MQSGEPRIPRAHMLYGVRIRDALHFAHSPGARWQGGRLLRESWNGGEETGGLGGSTPCTCAAMHTDGRLESDRCLNHQAKTPVLHL